MKSNHVHIYKHSSECAGKNFHWEAPRAKFNHTITLLGISAVPLLVCGARGKDNVCLRRQWGALLLWPCACSSPALLLGSLCTSAISVFVVCLCVFCVVCVNGGVALSVCVLCLCLYVFVCERMWKCRYLPRVARRGRPRAWGAASTALPPELLRETFFFCTQGEGGGAARQNKRGKGWEMWRGKRSTGRSVFKPQSQSAKMTSSLVMWQKPSFPCARLQ